jgi:hypothetical protein
MFKGQAEQDKFVTTVLKNKTNGFFIELGSSDPVNYNNTFVLEYELNWNGIMIEYEKTWANQYKLYRTKSLHIFKDSQDIDYFTLFKQNNVPHNIDYLQIDLDVDNSSTLNTTKKLDEQILNDYKFATITFEHDVYSSEHENDIWYVTRKLSREIFLKRGYELVFPDVQLPSNTTYRGKQCGAFEDWYVHPDLVDKDLINKYKTNKSLFFRDIMY